MNSTDSIYAELVNGLRLAASPFEVQRNLLPDFVHVPDEILQAVDSAHITHIKSLGVLNGLQLRTLEEYGSFIDSAPVDDEDLLDVADSKWFDELRRQAMAVLGVLNEGYRTPNLEGITYIPGE